ncbi:MULTISPECIES: PTS fructose transporter subunit IIABC [Ligilactobacillus]|uniref:PTS system, fructose-specific IIA component / PTS system, fructose-specific IIB component / PTS system, fructose-specific IIC component n=6 Tax=Ligilactobacillus salivarius TaxID=1624 RepID=V6DK10_9LACO|nr:MULTISPECIES: fructose-specific PTS transporter subunit EIIC [Ligilactobacillus]MCR4913152.1 fructose-specific PTS transporter subunit EIIC [Lactobacillus sp.]PEH10474.1 PTS fructose transporter subunit IIC [Lactobacillus sp. UMNPBX2]CDK34359.1 PTS system, fructose-specific IIA component / PTS system, fructose-specific IIB component / PTS system, fructose-specific IIC component [Ligilactobacillus salivarius cp400]AIR09957.1 PTS system, fructose-specific IIABC component [Ligilactobacillus sal
MDIRSLLMKDIMIMDLKATTKSEVIDEMVHNYYEHGIIDDEDLYKKDIIKREEEGSTGMGDGIAIPHAHDAAVKKPAVQFARSVAGVDYDSMDGQPAHLFFMIAAPEGGDNTHLQALAALSQVLMNPDVVTALKAADTPDKVQDIFAEAVAKKEAENKAEEEAEKAAANSNSDRPYIVAVTACPNGIAHTYMAEENLKKKAKELGVDIKVETNGSEGIKHRLTADEISRAVGVVIAADKKVEMNRFDGKPLVNKPVKSGIQEPEKLIQQVLDGKAAIYHATGDDSSSSTESDGTVWGNIYKQLMNGISHMLPFVIGGGILMAISFIVEQYMGGAKAPAFIFLNSAGNLAFAFMVPVLAAYIAESIGDTPALMPGFVGGFMASIANASLGGSYHVNFQANSTSPAGFLGGIAAGFIAGYLILGMKKMFAGLPRSVEGMKPMLLYPVFGLLFIALIMYFIVNPIFSTINLWITHFLNGMGTGNLVLLTLVLAGMMSIDMGGPFNKAAYVFASGAFANDPKSTTAAILMAAVMVGGMVPPFATAIGTAFFKNKYTEDERRAGVTNWILGFSFITEGAIPFATADPGRVIPSCIIGSAVSGAIVGAMRIGIPAPHGGFWVSPLATNIWGYFLAVIVGSIVAALIMSFWKKPVNEK